MNIKCLKDEEIGLLSKNNIQLKLLLFKIVDIAHLEEFEESIIKYYKFHNYY